MLAQREQSWPKSEAAEPAARCRTGPNAGLLRAGNWNPNTQTETRKKLARSLAYRFSGRPCAQRTLSATTAVQLCLSVDPIFFCLGLASPQAAFQLSPASPAIEHRKRLGFSPLKCTLAEFDGKDLAENRANAQNLNCGCSS